MGQWNDAQGVDGNRFNKSFRSLVIVYVWYINTRFPEGSILFEAGRSTGLVLRMAEGEARTFTLDPRCRHFEN